MNANTISQIRSKLRTVALIAAIIFMVVFGGIVAYGELTGAPARFDANLLCTDYGCDADTLFDNYREDLTVCRDETDSYNDAPQSFATCLDRRGVMYRS
ncbi:MAG: hypothetical protein AAF846_29820 [Chloroflexota bacterium]